MEQKQNVLADAALEGVHLAERYQVVSKLGKGGMAWVYKGHKLDGDEPVAIKVLFSQLSSDESFRVRFLREAQIQFQLQHENIVRVHDSFEDRGVVGFAMEWCNQGDLLEFMKARTEPLPWEMIGPLFLPLLDGLQLAHQRGVVHRDLKPQNILLHEEKDGSLRPKLTDFGIAKLLDAAGLTKTGAMVGTLHYMSPEQVQESKSVDHRTDIYSMGVLLYVMATRKMPFSGQAPSLMLKILQEDPRFPSEAPEPLQEVILRCLSKNPADRYADCEELKADLMERFGTLSDRIAVMIDGVLPGEALSTIKPLAHGDFVSREGVPSGSFISEADSTALAGPLLSSLASSKKGSRWFLWALIALSASAFLGFGLLKWYESQSSTQKSPLISKRVTSMTARSGALKSKTPMRTTPTRQRQLKEDVPDSIVRDTKLCETSKDLGACVRAGRYWSAGAGKPRYAARAWLVSKKACSVGLPDGCILWAPLLWRGYGGAKDQAKAESLLSGLCQKANKQACWVLGTLTLEKRLYPKSRAAFAKGCQEGHLKSCVQWGWFWQQGLGGKKSYKRAAGLYKQACHLGLGVGCNQLGFLLTQRYVRKSRFRSPSELFSGACQKEVAAGCYNLGLLWYQEGKSSAKNRKSLQAMEQGCAKRHARSCYLQGVLLWNSSNVTVGMRGRAEKLFETACRGKVRQACLVLGYIYTQSVERKRDCTKANPFLKRACTLGEEPCLTCPPKDGQEWKSTRPIWSTKGYEQKTFAH